MATEQNDTAQAVDITRDVLIDCITSFYVHGARAAEIADYLLSESSGLSITEAS